MSTSSTNQKNVTSAFQNVSSADRTDRKAENETRPFSIRLTGAERALLEKQAGNRPLGTYIRNVLLGDNAKKRRVFRRPVADDQKIALVLSQLGKSRIASNLNQLAHAANYGGLDVDDTVRDQLEEAYKAVYAMREALMIALRIKPGG